MKTINDRKRYFHMICIVLFIFMITISLGLKRVDKIEEKNIKKATFVKYIKRGESYLG